MQTREMQKSSLFQKMSSQPDNQGYEQGPKRVAVEWSEKQAKVKTRPRWPSGLRRWFANATPRETGFRIPPLPRAEFGRLKLE